MLIVFFHTRVKTSAYSTIHQLFKILKNRYAMKRNYCLLFYFLAYFICPITELLAGFDEIGHLFASM